MPEMETTVQPNGECDLLESRTTTSVRGATIHCTDNAERSGGCPATGGTHTQRNDGQSQTRTRQMFPKYECYISAGSHVDVGNDENDRTLDEEYARNKGQITVVTFLHKQFFRSHALTRINFLRVALADYGRKGKIHNAIPDII